MAGSSTRLKERVMPRIAERQKDNAAELGQHIGPADQMSGRVTHAIRTRADDDGHPRHQDRIGVG
jgi:hypothetical protein